MYNKGHAETKPPSDVFLDLTTVGDFLSNSYKSLKRRMEIAYNRRKGLSHIYQINGKTKGPREKNTKEKCFKVDTENQPHGDSEPLVPRLCDPAAAWIRDSAVVSRFFHCPS